MDFQKELIAEFDHEIANTRKMLAAIPVDADFAYKPHPKSMSLASLAGHISGLAGQWSISVLTTDKLEYSPDHKPYLPASTEALLAQFDQDVAKVKVELAKFAPEKWDGHWKFVYGGHVVIDQSKYQVWRICVLNHLIHHRAQLSVYLRLLDKPIPGIYGPSADEK
jgi:uncharacterized damage-inducible protein DinB